jgi:chromosomal replication initiator protein
MEIVSAVQHALVGKVGQERFDLWFSAGVALRLDKHKLVVAAADNFKLERIRRTFRSELQAACSEVLGSDTSIEFVREGSSAPTAALPRRRAISRPRDEQQQFPLFAATAPGEAMPAAVAFPAGATPALATPALAERRAPIVTTSSPASAVAAEPTTSADAPRPQRRQFASLDTFVVGDGNRMAHAAATSALAKLGTYSPLLIHGPTGSGKTHLLEGIWCKARQSGQLRRIVYLSAEQFTTQFIEALRGSGLPNFRRKYRDVELLIIDDVQFFAGKQSTLVELLHTIDTLLRNGRQLVFGADRPPAELGALGPEIVARLSGGLACGIEPADYATRLGILEQLVRRQSLNIDTDCLRWLAGQLDGDARQLAGALNRLQAASDAFGQEISVDFAQTALADLLRTSRKAVRLTDIVSAVSEVFGVEEGDLQAGGKSPAVSHPRMLAMWLARKYTRSALSEIGRYFGRRSHTTVLSAQTKVTQWLAQGKNLPLPHGSCSVEDALRRVESQLRLG